MTSPFDIFRSESNDRVLWLATATTLEDAKSRIEELSADSPGQYVVFNQHTGEKFVIKNGDANRTHTTD